MHCILASCFLVLPSGTTRSLPMDGFQKGKSHLYMGWFRGKGPYFRKPPEIEKEWVPIKNSELSSNEIRGFQVQEDSGSCAGSVSCRFVRFYITVKRTTLKYHVNSLCVTLGANLIPKDLEKPYLIGKNQGFLTGSLEPIWCRCRAKWILFWKFSRRQFLFCSNHEWDFLWILSPAHMVIQVPIHAWRSLR